MNGEMNVHMCVQVSWLVLGTERTETKLSSSFKFRRRDEGDDDLYTGRSFKLGCLSGGGITFPRLC